MPSALRDIIKQYFQTSDKPTQAQFYEWMDAIRYVDETLGVGDITGLTELLNAKASTVAVAALQPIILNNQSTLVLPPGFWLREMLIIAPTPISFRCGTVINGDDIVEQIDIVDGQPFVLHKYYPTETTIYFTGVTDDTSIVIPKP